MKLRKIRKAIISLLLVAAVICNLRLTSSVSVAEAKGTQPEEFSLVNNYNYRLSDKLNASPDTFECVIQLDGGFGGTIAGNYYSNLQGFDGITNWEVDLSGHPTVYWNNGQASITFDNVTVNDGKWHHLAFVRNQDEKTFALYLDGNLAQTVNVTTSDAVCNLHLNIGVDYKNWNCPKTPFDGKIKQVTIYSGALSAERIKQDAENSKITSDDTNAKLIGNWYLGEKWTNRYVENDKTGSELKAQIVTYEKYVGLSDSGDYDYSIIGIPDIQTMGYYRPERLFSLFSSLATAKSSLKAQFAIQVGDLADRGNEENLYRLAQKAIAQLDGVLPYSFVQGNHDYDDNAKTRSSVYFDRYFTYEKYSQTDTFGGAYEEGSMANTYSLFEVGDIKYLVLNLEFGPRMSVLRWACRVCEMYPERRIIVNTHAYVDPDGSIMDENSRFSATRYFTSGVESTTGQQIYDALIKRYSNIFLVLCGHNGTDDVVMRTDYGVNGNKITSVLIDAQVSIYNNETIGEDPVLIMKFNESTKSVNCSYYSFAHDAVYNLQNMFSFSIADANNPTIGK